MPPKISAVGPTGSGAHGNVAPSDTKDKWVNVTWMPHSTLSQTSHVSLIIRSAHATFDPIYDRQYSSEFYTDENPVEWKIRIGVFGVSGLLLVPVYTNSTAAALVSRRKSKSKEQNVGECSTNVKDPVAKASKGCLMTTILNATHDCWWDCLVQIPIRWRDLPRDAYLHFEVLGQHNIIVSSTTLPLFSKYGKLVTGLQKLNLESKPLHLDINCGLVPFGIDSKNDEKQDYSNDQQDPVWKACCILDQLSRIEERARSSTMNNNDDFGNIPSVPWLDNMLKARAEQMIADASLDSDHSMALEDASSALVIELPVFDIPIVHEEVLYPLTRDGTSGAVTPLDLSLYRKQVESKKLYEEPYHFDPLQLVPFLDYENERDNPVEDKYRTLAHDLLRGLVDPALKPNKEQRSRLAYIIDSPSHHPTREEKDLLWRFRFSLVDNRRALTKFLLAVDWTVESEVVQAAELLEQWRKRSPIEVTDALKLLGKNVAFQTNLVRSYAIDTLAAAPDSELRLYLLQLVQALKYENIDIVEPTSGTNTTRVASSRPMASTGAQVTQVSSLATFLINRAAANIQLANYLYWYLKVELADPTHGSKYREIFSALKSKLSKSTFSKADLNENHYDETGKSFKSIVDSVSKLGSSLGLTESVQQDRDRSVGKAHPPKARTVWDVLVEQDAFVSGVLDIQKRCRESRGKKDAKELELKSMLLKEGYDRKCRGSPVPLPSSPDIFVSGVNPETAKMFKSALYPALLEFHVEATIRSELDSLPSKRNNESSKLFHANHDEKVTTYKVMVKTGDDLRQDQLVIMMIQLMDGLLKRAALDLCLTPYSIIATSHNSGLVEFVDGAMPIAQVLYKYNNSILQFFQTMSPQNGAKYDVRPDVISIYLRSCAGYCVITYLLGVGDRHLDNILLRATGHFFHIDFGFIFGRDPKPLPPAFRLTREMVDGMGGVDSTEYRQFCSLACQAFNSLRKSAGLILNLLHLMSDAGIEDLSSNPAAEIGKVEERFRLNLTDEQAERFFLGLINDCLSAIAPRVMDVFHSFAVARR